MRRVELLYNNHHIMPSVNFITEIFGGRSPHTITMDTSVGNILSETNGVKHNPTMI